ncbi:NADH-dependent flavin oxidoreductase [Paenibacillus macerans]|uniref:NADH-dependent flavin oxidoreductase n=1 Tax=Paenibacillus macerans TaxID=44252 RepID=UPI000EE398C4|nr:NADH-dependent flavin oxidoreductase [Paenibacillus macerans]GBK61941.1 NADH-dependent flavin oxidoreductase [Paenibacillus macerans]GBK68248.1 NADH-dependent flavin oxidoreductase [Paenibacillus macerans]
MNQKYESLFKSFTLSSGVQLKNRVLMAPMSMTASGANGELTDVELAFYKARAQGVGAVVTGALVSPNGKLIEHGIGIDNDTLLPGLQKLTVAIRENGAKAIVQLYHGGRLSNPALVPGGHILGASPVAVEREGAAVPKAMTDAEIETVIEEYAQATRRAIEAGFDGVEIHGANGFLMQQFFSPRSNRREDKWGGTLEKRMTLPLEVVRRVKETVAAHATSPFAVGYRISPEENETPGITMTDTLHFVDVLAEQTLDYIHISVDRFWAGPRRDDSIKKSRIVMIQERVGDRVPVIGVGGLLTPDDVVQALETGVPLISLGHAMVMNPEWVALVQSGREQEIKTTLSRSAQKELMIPDVFRGMITNTPGWFQVVD